MEEYKTTVDFSQYCYYNASIPTETDTGSEPTQVSRGRIVQTRLLLVILFLIPISSAHGQAVQSLHQALTSNMLIDRSLVFREMQASIEEEMAGVEPGAKVDLLFKKMSAIRTPLLDAIQAPKVELETTQQDGTTQYRLRFSMPLGPSVSDIQFSLQTRISANDVLSRLEKDLAVVLTGHMRRLPIGASEQQRAIFASLLVSIDESGVVSISVSDASNGDFSARLGSVLARLIVLRLKQEIRLADPAYDGDRPYEAEGTIRAFIDGFNARSEEAATLARESVVKALNRAEHDITQGVETFSKLLISGSAGLAVTQNEGGALGGGLNISWVSGTSFQMGVYANGQLSQSDTTDSDTPAQSLIGFQGRYAGDRLQLDLLAAVLFADKDFKAGHFDLWQVGGGISYRPNNDFIFGVAGFGLFGPGVGNAATVGLTLKATSAASPAVLLGVERQNDETRPVLQISFPVGIKR